MDVIYYLYILPRLITLQVVANGTYNAELLNLDLWTTDKSSKLLVGDGFLGCLSDGPGIYLNSSSLDASNVEWMSCPLPSGSCEYTFCGVLREVVLVKSMH